VELTSTQAELTSTQTHLTSTQAELTSTQTQLTSAQTELETTKEEIGDLQVSYDQLISKHGYTIEAPTYKQMMTFITEDKSGNAIDMCNSAEEKGIRCAYVSVRIPEGMAFVIVAFNTIDKGLIYIEPQHNNEVRPIIGKHYYKCVIPNYGKPGYDDTIEQILIIW
jgi:predicted transcriptional regulator